MTSPAAKGEGINPRKGRRVVAAAVMLRGGHVVVGVRHFDALMRAAIDELRGSDADRRKAVAGSIQGFVTNDYQFVARDEAWLIALRAGQFDPKDATGTQGTLYSEDLW